MLYVLNINVPISMETAQEFATWFMHYQMSWLVMVLWCHTCYAIMALGQQIHGPVPASNKPSITDLKPVMWNDVTRPNIEKYNAKSATPVEYAENGKSPSLWLTPLNQSSLWNYAEQVTVRFGHSWFHVTFTGMVRPVWRDWGSLTIST